MTYAAPEENTLGIILGRGKRRESDGTRRAIGTSTVLRSSLGVGFIGVGVAVVVGLRVVYGLIWLVALWGSYPHPLLNLAAWLILISVATAAIVVSRSIVGDLPNWMFAVFLTGLAASIALDFYAVWPLNDIGRNATAAATAGMALVIVATNRRLRDILVAASVIAVTFFLAMFINTARSDDNYAAQITTLATVVLFAVIGAFVVRGFRRLVQVDLDRVLVQSTVSAPRFAVGMMASEELARLDLAAEELLDAVSTGRTKLPLDPKTASVAASLATELRLHLIEGRRETWLYHAITESELLGKVVTLSDKGSLAGLLDPHQRDGLLSAVWLLISDTAKNAGLSVQITVGPITESVETGYGRKITVPVALNIVGVPRKKVDPAMWEALSKMGPSHDSTQNSMLRVDVACLVDNPADQ